MGRRTTDGRETGGGDRGIQEDVMTYTAFRGATLIRGETLDRYWLDEARSARYVDPRTKWYWVYRPPQLMVEAQCDNCVRRHRPTNLNCSATRHVLTRLTDPNTLYSFATQTPEVFRFVESVVTDGTVQGVLVTAEIST